MARLGGLPEARRLEMGRRGYEHIRSHYGLDRVAERWEEIYREVLARKGVKVDGGGLVVATPPASIERDPSTWPQ
jgi:hypothetical protein